MSNLTRGLALAALLCTGGCGEGTPLEPESDLRVSLVSPIDGMAVAQNDPSIGCPPHPDRGYGFKLVLVWDDATHPSGVEGYELVVRHRGARYPMIETTTEGSGHRFLACNSFVIDQNLDDWEWSVRALAMNGEVGDWSQGEFSFQPCRLETGAPCHAPPPEL